MIILPIYNIIILIRYPNCDNVHVNLLHTPTCPNFFFSTIHIRPVENWVPTDYCSYITYLILFSHLNILRVLQIDTYSTFIFIFDERVQANNNINFKNRGLQYIHIIIYINYIVYVQIFSNY